MFICLDNTHNKVTEIHDVRAEAPARGLGHSLSPYSTPL